MAENRDPKKSTAQAPGPCAGDPLSGWALECLSRLFSALGDPTRLQILNTLVNAPDGVSVGDLAEQIGLSVSAVSHQLRLLNDRNLVASRRSGRLVLYTLADDHVQTLLATGLEHAREDCPNRPRE